MSTEDDTPSAYEEWEAAEQAARVEAQRLADAWERHTLGAPPPSPAFKAEVRRLRNVASSKLAAALSMMRCTPVEQEFMFHDHSWTGSQDPTSIR